MTLSTKSLSTSVRFTILLFVGFFLLSARSTVVDFHLRDFSIYLCQSMNRAKLIFLSMMGIEITKSEKKCKC